MNKTIPRLRGLGYHTHSGMTQSLLSPFPNEFNVLYTNFLDLNKIPKATVTDTVFNIAQKLNFLQRDASTNSQTDTPLFNMGVNTNNQLFLKTEAEEEVLGGANPPALLIDGATGNVYINGSQITQSQSTGFLFEFNTQGITQYNRDNASLGLLGQWQIPNTLDPRFDNIFYGSPIGPPYAWNVQTIPSGSIPNNQLILNQSGIPGNVVPGFRAYASNGVKLPVDCVISGRFFPVDPIDGALLNNVGHTFSNTPITQDFTANYTLTVGIVKREYTGALPTPVIQTLVSSQDITVPFRGNYQGTVAQFSCSFAFEMELENGPNPLDYCPFFNHNGIIYPNTPGNIRWEDVTISFTTKANI